MSPRQSELRASPKKRFKCTKNQQKVLLFTLAAIYVFLATQTYVFVAVDSEKATKIHRNPNRFKVQSFASVRLRQMQRLLQSVKGTPKNARNINLVQDAIQDGKEPLIRAPKIDTPASVSSALAKTLTADEGMASYSNMESCFRYGTADDNIGESFAFLRDDCRLSEHTGSKKLVIYNPYKSRREWCGKKIPAFGMVSLLIDEVATCTKGQETHAAMYLLSPPSIFDPEEDRTIRVFQDSKRGMEDIECDVPCQWGKVQNLVKNLKIEGTNWKFIWSMEGATYYPQLIIKPDAYLRDQYYATTSFKSDILKTYFSWDANLRAEPVQFDNVIHGASFLARNCNSKNNREAWVRELQKHFRVDSLSRCLNNAKPPAGVDLKNKQAVMKQYLFHLAFENSNYEDYITEKYFDTLKSGTVPVYLGAPNIKEHAPPGSTIFIDDFPSYEALGEYLTKVANNKTLYEQYHEWRKHDLPEFFVEKYNFNRIASTCRACRWAYAKKYGFGWNHANQSIIDPTMNTLCTDDRKSGLVVHPFTENWQSKESSTTNAKEVRTAIEKCDKSGLNSKVFHDNYIVHRSFSQHDNVIDLVLNIESAQKEGLSPLYLRLETAIQTQAVHISHLMNDDQKKNQNVTVGSQAFMQDEESRFTVLSDWTTKFLSPQEGTIEILIYDGARNILPNEVFLRRIRIILEAQNKLHYNFDDTKPSYFANIATEEFSKPLEFFALPRTE